uniref:Hemoglobin, alpha embryonic 5 n=1 Tax=Neogobius melanostomus TaxID=47308 RepID=A0A8C6S4B4_9GOBI
MSLTPKDKAAVRDLWKKISGASDVIGAETLGRLFACYPQTKIYFSHWTDVSYGSPQVKKHGKTILEGVGRAVASMDDMNKGLLELSETHAFKLKIDPTNFKLMAQCLMVVIAIMFPKDFTEEAHLATDKFLANLALALSEKYR